MRDWDALCDNLHPTTGESLTLRTRNYRRIGYDFTFNAPKSLSVLHALTRDERLLDAFRESVRETMVDIELEMQTRVRKGGHNEDRVTGNAIWGEFTHFTSRPVENALPDPQLHTHCFVFNATYDEKEQAHKAGQFGHLKRDASYHEAKFHVRLGEKLAALGLPVVHKRKYWEIDGISPSIVEKFSLRTKEIEAEARRRGITDPVAKAELGAKTRSRKQKAIPMDVLRAHWRSRLSDDERDTLAVVADRVGGLAIALDEANARQAVGLASEHCFERQSVVPERRLLAESLMRSVGRASVEHVEQAYQAQPFLVRERAGRRMTTTNKVLAEEQHMLELARTGLGTRRAFKAGPHHFTRGYFNKGQRSAVEHMLHSTDFVILVRGAAGTGKTSLLLETVEAIEATGTRVFAFAPSARASRGVLQEKGFAEADTVARLLVDQELQERSRGQVLLIDEAGMIGVRTMCRLFELADTLECRVILAGDRYQHGSVEAGAALRLLEEQVGLRPAEIKGILRQKDQYKRVVQDLSEQRATDGFRKLDAMGWIHEVEDDHRYTALAADYIESVAQGMSALVVSPSRLESERCTEAVRHGLQQRALLERTERRFATLRNANLTEGERKDVANYSPGDTLIFNQNAKGYKRGERVEVAAPPPPVDQAARFQLFHQSSLDIAVGDVLRITQNGKTLDGRGRLHNGDLVHVTGFDPKGNICTRENKTIAQDFGHLAMVMSLRVIARKAVTRTGSLSPSQPIPSPFAACDAAVNTARLSSFNTFSQELI
ncbi:MAG: traI [Schlesneria sp.]|nr:traI [Schlesneria sp.]